MAINNMPRATHTYGERSYDVPTNLLEVLDGIEFPASLPEIVDYAMDQGAAEELLEELRAMPDRDYDDMQEVNRYHAKIEILPGEAAEENMFSSQDAPADELPTEIHDRPVILQRR